MGDDKFEGFPRPETNYFRIPNCWTDLTSTMKSRSEVLVIEYVIRHTWGFGEYDKFKQITIDEFEHGRKQKDGSRMDRGTRLSNKSIYAGLNQAVEDGFLEVRTDESDKARVRKLYRLKMTRRGVESTDRGVETTIRSVESTPQGGRNYTPIRERHLRKTPKGGRKPSPPSRNGFLLTPWDRKAAEYLKKILVENKTDLCRIRVDTLVKVIYRLRTDGRKGAGKDQIKAYLKWYGEHYGEQWVPRMFKSGDFYSHWDKHLDAMKRWEVDNGVRDPDQSADSLPDDLRQNLIGELLDAGWDLEDDLEQEDLDRILVAMGRKPGSVKAGQVV